MIINVCRPRTTYWRDGKRCSENKEQRGFVVAFGRKKTFLCVRSQHIFLCVCLVPVVGMIVAAETKLGFFCESLKNGLVLSRRVKKNSG